jgi:hypothetical protein
MFASKMLILIFICFCVLKKKLKRLKTRKNNYFENLKEKENLTMVEPPQA